MTPDSEITLLSDDELVTLGNALLDRADRETSEWESTLDARVMRTLVRAARSAAAAHDEACGSLLESRPMTWRGVVAYRDALIDGTLEPLCQAMERTRPADRIRTSLRDLRRSLREASSAHPAVLTACDPPEFYDTLPDDPPRVRWLKRGVRIRRRVDRVVSALGRLLGRRSDQECRRDVDIRSFWHAHVDERLGSRHYLRHEEMQVLWARPWVQMMHAATTLMEAVLLLDQAHDVPGLHFPEGASGAEKDREISEADSGAMRQAIGPFQQALQNLVTLAPLPARSTADAGEIFRRSLLLAGTPLLPRSWRPGGRTPAWGERLEVRGGEWDQWARRGEVELRALVGRVRLRRDITALEDQLLARLHRQTLQPLVEVVDRLGGELRSVRDRLTELAPGEVKMLDQALVTASARAEETERLIDLAGVSRAEKVLDHLGSREARRIEGLIAQLPDEVVPTTVTESHDVDPATLPVPWSPRDAAREAFQPPLPVLLGGAVPRYRDRVIKAWALVHQVPHIVEYALDAAREALRATGDDTTGEGDETPSARALTVAGDGLTRAADTLTRAVEGLQPAWGQIARTIWEVLHGDWTDFQRRAHRAMADQRSWHGLRASAALAIRRRWYLARHAVGHAWENFQPRIAAAVSWVRQLLSRGQAAVGVARPTEAQWLSTVDSLDEVTAHRATFPVVYRRLFGDGPLERRQLLAGRDAPLELARDHIARWACGHPAGTLLIEALPGGGRTSFLSVLAEEVESVPVRWMTLTERITSEEALARILGDVLGQPAASSLAELESVLLSAEPRSGGVVIVDDIEFLFLHVPEGAWLMEAFLGFCTRSDSRVHWILSLNGVAGPVARAEIAEALRAVRHVRLDPLGRGELELALLTRHEWSGLALQVLPPDSPGFLLRQRLARARTGEARDRLLRSLYLDRLARATGGDIGQTLFYWLQSATFEEGGGEGQGQPGDRVTLRPVERLDYRFLDTLPLVSTMTLRALFMHATLTVTEHAAIFRLSEERSRQTLEHLLALRILEPHLAEGASDTLRTEAGVRVVPGVAYRVRPIMRHPILDRIRATNLLPRGTR